MLAQSFGEQIDGIGKLAPGLAVVAVGIDDGFLVGDAGHSLVQDLAKGLFTQFEQRLALAHFLVHGSSSYTARERGLCTQKGRGTTGDYGV